MGGSHYDGAANQQQRNVPRAYLRSATHEVGHAFNQIHQNFELGLDNSIMSPTPSVAQVLGTAGLPGRINLGFNTTVTEHLRHLPDPAVRPGAMDFFGAAVSAPQASDVAWLDARSDRHALVRSDRPRRADRCGVITLTNTGASAVPVPETLDVAALTVGVNVTDPWVASCSCGPTT